MTVYAPLIVHPSPCCSKNVLSGLTVSTFPASFQLPTSVPMLDLLHGHVTRCSDVRDPASKDPGCYLTYSLAQRPALTEFRLASFNTSTQHAASSNDTEVQMSAILSPSVNKPCRLRHPTPKKPNS